MSTILALKLHNFRSYAQAALMPLERGLVVLAGPNGAGKTNILEALSLLTPGKGLRGARAGEIQSRHAPDPWAISAHLRGHYEDVRIGTGLDPASQGTTSEKRTIRINGQSVKSQGALAEYLACVWLTPQMDRLFLDSSRERRRFLDRLVFSFDPGHAGRVTRYDNALSQRSKLLREGKGEPAWLDALEEQMAETGVAIAAARLDFTHRLQKACERTDHTHFPLARFAVSGALEARLAGASALNVEEGFKESLQRSRMKDALTGGAATGPHKSDLAVTYAAKDMAAEHCSTGEQKALLIGLILAHARLITAARGHPPILLLDEVAAHLDEGRRAALYRILMDLNAQAFLTGTDNGLFHAIKTTAQFFDVQDSVISQLQHAA